MKKICMSIFLSVITAAWVIYIFVGIQHVWYAHLAFAIMWCGSATLFGMQLYADAKSAGYVHEQELARMRYQQNLDMAEKSYEHEKKVAEMKSAHEEKMGGMKYAHESKMMEIISPHLGEINMNISVESKENK